MKSNELLKKFIEDASEELSSTLTKIRGRVFEVHGAINYMIYIKIRTNVNQNWGITSNVIENIKSKKIPWFVLLLSVHPTAGYLLSPEDVESYIANSWKLNKDGDYKTSPKFPGGNKFNTLKQLREKIQDNLVSGEYEVDETLGDITMTEGGKKVRISMQAERNPKLRSEAIKRHGLVCKVCGFDFGDIYGDWGKGFIEVHHIKPLGGIKSKRVETDPQNDLIVLCSNCHSMVHQKHGITLTVEELKNKIRQKNKND